MSFLWPSCAFLWPFLWPFLCLSCVLLVPFLWPWRAGEVPPRVVCFCLVLGGSNLYPGETMRQSYVFARFGCFQVITWRNHASELC